MCANLEERSLAHDAFEAIAEDPGHPLRTCDLDTQTSGEVLNSGLRVLVDFVN